LGHVWYTLQCVGGVHTLSRSTYGTSRHQKISFHCVIEGVTTSFSWWCSACRRWAFLFLLFFLHSKSYNLTLFVIDISTSILILFISNFFLGLFVEVLFIFNFITQSWFSVNYFFQFDLHSFDYFFGIFLIYFSFQLHPLIINMFVILYFNFNHYSFNCYSLFWILLCNWYSYSKLILQHLIGWELDFVVFTDRVFLV